MRKTFFACLGMHALHSLQMAKSLQIGWSNISMLQTCWFISWQQTQTRPATCMLSYAPLFHIITQESHQLGDIPSMQQYGHNLLLLLLLLPCLLLCISFALQSPTPFKVAMTALASFAASGATKTSQAC
jgi:hypothetical protein